ncbi:uncharacterized protein Z519_08770 [Cladophialophora bantiana CBS 173.52]|uniref:alpha-1,2-Mannosidase n=1 Tax=Cladophialophora bantiana (strain ATCC 10958 / CBS 173.52 / CDC B-1940 / NIH 8579) TaxID=1442370 RepID=A0A0D2FWY1_CLAB1|nr:uncharacterized protein Z519_08770 [Cladophialophora bantiana CBS 173.52]KIW90987.1 hypothetical protein Z519_08770 [Cladophialophora bantiana CBS 173.52]
MAGGVMPGIAYFVACPSKVNCTWVLATYGAAVLDRVGFISTNSNANDIVVQKRLPPGCPDVNDGRCILRPAAIKSVFIMYRFIDGRNYREKAGRMFGSIKKITRTEFAIASISDVTATDLDHLPPRDDQMESFWLAETLKYFYWIFSEPDPVSLDEYAVNTEAHPLQRPT